MRPSFGPNLPQSGTHSYQKAIFRHTLAQTSLYTEKDYYNLPENVRAELTGQGCTEAPDWMSMTQKIISS